MEQRKRKLAATLLAAAASAVLAAPAHAVTFTEPPSDAGQTLATAQSTGTNNTTPLTSIFGTLSSPSDADLYLITITAAGTFSATTNNSVTNASGVDTALFLFTLSGTAIATNDDGSPTTVTSLLAAGNSLYTGLAAGRYLIAISSSGNEAVNAVNQLLFAGYPAGNTTATRGAAAGTNPTTLATFNGAQFDNTTFGAYEIDFTSVNTAVPEPSTLAALGLGTVASAFAFLRRRRQQA